MEPDYLETRLTSYKKELKRIKRSGGWVSFNDIKNHSFRCKFGCKLIQQNET